MHLFFWAKSICSGQKSTPKDKIFYTDNVRASVTNSMSVYFLRCLVSCVLWTIGPVSCVLFHVSFIPNPLSCVYRNISPASCVKCVLGHESLFCLHVVLCPSSFILCPISHMQFKSRRRD